MTTRIGTWLAVVAGAAVVAVLGSCGGGGDGGQDGVTPPPPTGITATGAITGFGSVYVNGVRFTTSAADIEIDGAKATQADLKVGEVVDIKGTMQDGSAKADVVRYNHNLEGPVTAIDGLTLVAMGQTVRVGSGRRGIASGNVRLVLSRSSCTVDMIPDSLCDSYAIIS